MTCIFCGTNCDVKDLPKGGDGKSYQCRNCGPFHIARTVLPKAELLSERNKSLVSHAIWKRNASREIPFIHSRTLKDILAHETLPKSQEQLFLFIKYLGQNTVGMGTAIEIIHQEFRAKLGAQNSNAVTVVINAAESEGLVKADSHMTGTHCALTFEGQQLYESMAQETESELSGHSDEAWAATQDEGRKESPEVQVDETILEAGHDIEAASERRADDLGQTESAIGDTQKSAAAPQEPNAEPPISPNSQTIEVGDDHRAVREASDDELCLDVQKYANVLGKYFRGATEGDFCFALFGPWGRGKTRLLKEVDDRNTLNTRGQKYEVVWFSAWKYRTTPEVWVHLFQTFARKCAGRGDPVATILRFPRTVRAGIARWGYLPIILGMLTFGLLAIPSSRLFGLVVWPLISFFGFASVLYLLRLYWHGADTVDSFGKRYAVIADHTDKLGLQALVGTDLDALLRGWIPRVPKQTEEPTAEEEVPRRRQLPSWCGAIMSTPRSAYLYPGAFFGAVLMFVSWLFWPRGPRPGGLVPGIELTDVFPDSAAAWFQEHLSFSPAPWIQWSILAVWLIASVGGSLWVWLGSRDTSRILLVVDDLDRCEPAQMLEIIESLKLLLEEPEIMNRVQIVMLIEEESLKNAIAEKFDGLIKRRTELDPRFDAERLVIREHREKLFISHLRLEPLTAKEIEVVAKRYLDVPHDADFDIGEDPRDWSRNFGLRTEPGGPARKAESGDEPRFHEDGFVLGDEATGDRSIEEILLEAEGHAPDEPIIERVSESFSSEEKRLLALAVTVSAGGGRETLWNPRSIRAFILKYKLSRLILAELNGEPPEPTALVGALLSQVSRGNIPHKTREDIRQVVLQVR